MSMSADAILADMSTLRARLDASEGPLEVHACAVELRELRYRLELWEWERGYSYQRPVAPGDEMVN